ncbi:hypothetical protein ACFX2I_027573 [Malus domestica]
MSKHLLHFPFKSNNACDVCSLAKQSQVQISGLRVLYQEDLQGFVQAFIRCILRSSTNVLFDHYSEMMVKQWIDFIKQQSHNKAQHSEGRTSPRIRRHSTMSPAWARKTGLRLSSHAASLELKFPNGLDSYIEADLMREFNCLRICTMIATGWELLYVFISLSTSIVLLMKQRPTQKRLVLRKLIQPLFVNCSPMLLPREFLAPSLQTKPCGWMPAVSLGSYIRRVLFSRSLNQCDRICAILTSRNPDIWQHACARRLVYKQDVDDLVQILTLSTLKAGSSPFSSSLVFSNNQEEVIQENPQPSENVSFARPKPPSILEISICKIPLPLDNIQLKLNTMRSCLFSHTRIGFIALIVLFGEVTVCY